MLQLIQFFSCHNIWFNDSIVGAGMIGAVGKISVFWPQDPSSIPGSAEIWIFVRLFPHKLIRLSILQG